MAEALLTGAPGETGA